MRNLRTKRTTRKSSTTKSWKKTKTSKTEPTRPAGDGGPSVMLNPIYQMVVGILIMALFALLHVAVCKVLRIKIDPDLVGLTVFATSPVAIIGSVAVLRALEVWFGWEVRVAW